MNEIGARIKSLREAFKNPDGKKLSGTKLAEHVHVTQGFMSAIEREEKRPSIELLIELARFFNVSVDYLIGLTDEPHGFAAPSRPSELKQKEIEPVSGSEILVEATTLRKRLKTNIYTMDEEDMRLTRDVLDSCVAMIDSLTDTEKQAKTAG